ncbi:MAG: transglutaminase-like domain-containing protein, partial [Azoarcus sp.]|nr:transglutaminase-like domain-containing protein [Azoarcus sp.]
LDTATPSARPSLVDLNNLPWQIHRKQSRAPLTKAAALDQALALNTRKATTTSTATQIRPLAGSNQLELSATLDAPHSTEIKALAAQLDNNPYRIHQWVYDNIRFFPTYGSVQGAEETLAKKSGNAFDTASLLIALLRSAGIESRYVYGTIDIPAEQLMNWVGDAKTPDAAQQILGQGGIPNTALTSGGKVVSFRLEHVWVEAWIKFHPERGIDHVGGVSEGDSWVPLDASFKQYTFTKGMDVQDALPFDTEALLTAAQQGAEINEAEGWVRNVNQTAVENRFKAYQQQLKNYLEQQNNGQSTVGDVLGTTRIKINPLPYPITDPEKFKEEGYHPTSHYDICACEDGSLVIYQVGQCGRINWSKFPHVTGYRWK